MSLKKMLRKQMMDMRNAIPPQLRQQKSFYISKLLLDQDIFNNSEREIKTAFLYLPFASEFDTSFLFKALSQKYIELYIPRVNKLTNKMDIIKYRKDMKMVISSFGIMEPSAEEETHPASILDLVIVPGLAFSAEMDRLGYGGGYYDRLFSEPDFKAIKAAPCFYEQVVDRLPREEHDKKLDLIVSDKCIYTLDK